MSSGAFDWFSKPAFSRCVAVVIVSLVVDMSPAAGDDGRDCTETSEYASGRGRERAPETCTVPLEVNDSETKMIYLLSAKCQQLPMQCILRKYTIYTAAQNRS